MSEKGSLFWLTGLSGAGKTTIGKELYKLLKEKYPNTVHMDGDQMREIFGEQKTYNIEDRKTLAFRYGRLCKVLTEQGLNVVCSTISLFPEVWEWNRKNVPSYYEVYVRVPMEILIERDRKSLYSKAEKGEIKDVMGIDIPLVEPVSPDIIIDNKGDITPLEQAKKIFVETVGKGL